MMDGSFDPLGDVIPVTIALAVLVAVVLVGLGLFIGWLVFA